MTRLNHEQTLKMQELLEAGFLVGDREPRLNTAFKGAYMVAERYEESELPTEDARHGPLCIVGDDLGELVEQAWENWVG